jgi:hypothetical protein
MSTLRNGWGHRAFWCGLATVMCITSVVSALHAMDFARMIAGIGWAMLAAAWLFQPPVLTRGLSNSPRSSAEVLVGPPSVRMWLGGGGLALILLGFVLRVTGAA